MDEHQIELPIQGYVKLHVPSHYSYLRIIRQSLLFLCNRAQMPESDTSKLEMAVDEASANIIEHSYEHEEHREAFSPNNGLHLSVTQHQDRIIVEISDYGKGFEFHQHTLIDPSDYLEEGRERGLGMFIINRFVDEISYERKTDKSNCLKLVKFL